MTEVSQQLRITPQARTQARLLRFMWENPNSTLKEAARSLKISYFAARHAASRLRKRPDYGHLCPLCFAPNFYNGVCQSCGYESDRIDAPIISDFDSQSPAHSIQPLGGLGSVMDYRRLRLQYGGNNIANLVKSKSEDRFVEKCRSKLWERLKSDMPSDYLTEVAARLLISEIRYFRANYSPLIGSRGAADAVVENVLARLAAIGGTVAHPKEAFN